MAGHAVEFALERLRALKSDEKKPDPYLWIAFFKIDGETMRIRTHLTPTGKEGHFNAKVTFQGTPTVHLAPDAPGKFPDNIGIGAPFALPDHCRWKTDLHPLPIDVEFANGAELSGIEKYTPYIGMVAVLMEEDMTSSAVRKAGFSKFAENLHKIMAAATAQFVWEGPLVIKKCKVNMEKGPDPTQFNAESLKPQIEQAVAQVRNTMILESFMPKLPTESLLGPFELFDPDDYIGTSHAATNLSSIVTMTDAVGGDPILGGFVKGGKEEWVLEGTAKSLMPPAPIVLAPHWHPWQNVGGKIDGGIAVDHEEGLNHTVLYANAGGKLWTKWWNHGKGWTPSQTGWKRVKSPDLDLKPGVAPVLQNDEANRQHIFAVAKDGSVKLLKWDPVNKKWDGWHDLGGKVDGISAVRLPEQDTIVLYASAGNRLFQRWYQGGKWHPAGNWAPLGGEFEIRSAPAVVATPEYQQIFAMGADHAVYLLEYEQATGVLHPWRSIGGVGGPAKISAIHDPAGRTTLYVNVHGKLFRGWSPGGVGAPWYPETSWDAINTPVGLANLAPVGITWGADVKAKGGYAHERADEVYFVATDGSVRYSHYGTDSIA